MSAELKSPSPTKLSEPRAALYILLGLIAAVLCAYAAVVRCDFVDFDDNSHILENPLVRDGLSWRGIAAAFTNFHASLWIPLTWISLMADVSLFGLNPGAMHAVNLALHAASTAVLFLSLRRMTGSLWASAFVAALFGLHPINVESVAWAAERKNVLSTFFCLLAISAYARFTEKSGRWPYSAAILCTALSLLAKPMAVTLPCVLLLLDFWPLNRWTRVPWMRLLGEKIPFAFLAAGACWMALQAPAERGAHVSAETLPIVARLSNALVSYAAYLRDFVWPTKHAVLNPQPNDPQPFLATLAALLLLALTAAAWVWRKRSPYLLFGWLWFLGVLVPVLGLVQVGSQARADRFTYLPQIGIFIALTWVVKDWQPQRRTLLAGAAAAVLAACALLTMRQIGWWMNSVSLFERAVAVTHDNACATANAGLARVKLGDDAVAVRHFQTSLRVQAEQPEIWKQFGAALNRLGHAPQAAECFRTALRLDDTDAAARYSLASALQKAGSDAEAIVQFQHLLARLPNLPGAHHQIALLLEKSSRSAEALAHLRVAARLAPHDATIAAALERLEGARPVL